MLIKFLQMSNRTNALCLSLTHFIIPSNIQVITKLLLLCSILIADSTEPSTLMGQFMEALNSQTNLDDLNLNIDSFQGGLECNVDEVCSIARNSYIF